MKRLKSGAFACVVVATCAEFGNEAVLPVTVEKSTGWGAEIFVQDVETLQIKVTLPNAADVSGLNVSWRSSDEAVLGISPVSPRSGAGREDTLAAQLRAVATGRAGGVATVHVLIERGGAFEPAESTFAIRVLQKWISVSTSNSRSCAVNIVHDVYCWGQTLLGDGSSLSRAIPTLVIGGLKFRSVTSGISYTCGALLDGRLYCWGANSLGNLGSGVPDDALVPAPVAVGRTFSSVTAGDAVTCGLVDAVGYCWGDNRYWQLGDAVVIGNNTPFPPFDSCFFFLSSYRCSLKPRLIRGRGNVPLELLAVAPGTYHTCAILVRRDTSEYLQVPLPVHTSGDALCWGTGSAEIGSDTVVTTDSTGVPPPLLISGGLKFKSLEAGDAHTCGITDPDSAVFCWGLNDMGQLGVGVATTSARCRLFPLVSMVPCSPTPVRVAGMHVFRQLSLGGSSTCGITADSAAYCWGSNQSGQLGTTALCDGARNCPTPIKVDLPDTSRVISIGVANGHGCAVTRRGAAFCWGSNGGWGIGNGSAPSSVPVGPTRVSEPF